MINTPVIYHIDHDDRIVACNAAWESFADTNGWHSPKPAVVGRRLWDFVAGREVVTLWKELFTVARNRQVTYEIPFRCDSPDWRREMSLMVIPQEKDQIECRATTLRLLPHPVVTATDAAGSQTIAEALIRICSWCKKLVINEQWTELPDGINRLRVFELSRAPALTHGVCPTCRQDMLARLQS